MDKYEKEFITTIEDLDANWLDVLHTYYNMYAEFPARTERYATAKAIEAVLNYYYDYTLLKKEGIH